MAQAPCFCATFTTPNFSDSWNAALRPYPDTVCVFAYFSYILVWLLGFDVGIHCTHGVVGLRIPFVPSIFASFARPQQSFLGARILTWSSGFTGPWGCRDPTDFRRGTTEGDPNRVSRRRNRSEKGREPHGATLAPLRTERSYTTIYRSFRRSGSDGLGSWTRLGNPEPLGTKVPGREAVSAPPTRRWGRTRPHPVFVASPCQWVATWLIHQCCSPMFTKLICRFHFRGRAVIPKLCMSSSSARSWMVTPLVLPSLAEAICAVHPALRIHLGHWLARGGRKKTGWNYSKETPPKKKE